MTAFRVGAEAATAERRGHYETAARHQRLAASYQILHEAYRQREAVFAAAMADRADWERALFRPLARGGLARTRASGVRIVVVFR